MEEAPKTYHLEPNDEGIFRAYANYFGLVWSATDIAIRFAQMAPNDDEDFKGILAIEDARITMSWGAAKALKQMLETALNDYEKANESKIKLPSELKIP